MWRDRVQKIKAQAEGSEAQHATYKFLRDSFWEKVVYMFTTWLYLYFVIVETVPQMMPPSPDVVTATLVVTESAVALTVTF